MTDEFGNSQVRPPKELRSHGDYAAAYQNAHGLSAAVL